MIRTRRRVGRATISALLTAAILAGCVTQLPFTESFEMAIPKALLASDLGITEASADNGIDGLAVNLVVVVVFDRSTVTTDDLNELLVIIVEHNNLSNLHDLEILGIDGNAPDWGEPDYDDDTYYIDLGAVGEQLGFPTHSSHPDDFVADWDDVVEFLRE